MASAVDILEEIRLGLQYGRIFEEDPVDPTTVTDDTSGVQPGDHVRIEGKMHRVISVNRTFDGVQFFREITMVDTNGVEVYVSKLDGRE